MSPTNDLRGGTRAGVISKVSGHVRKRALEGGPEVSAEPLRELLGRVLPNAAAHRPFYPPPTLAQQPPGPQIVTRAGQLRDGNFESFRTCSKVTFHKHFGYDMDYYFRKCAVEDFSEVPPEPLSEFSGSVTPESAAQAICGPHPFPLSL